MLSIPEVLFFVLYHYIADFLFQTNEQARNKSRSMKHLLFHTGLYSGLWYIPVSIYSLTHDGYTQWSASLFILITFVAHTVTDFFTSRIAASYYRQGKERKFFWVVGFDQVLHYVQLYLTYYVLFK